MLRKTLNRIFSSRVFYILFSVLASIALWMYVEISVYQEQPHEVQNVPIVFRHEEVLHDRGLLISSYSPGDVTLTFLIPRTVAAKLQPNTLSVEVDLSGITSTGAKLLEYSIIYPSGVTGRTITVTPSVELISLIVDRLHTVPVPVKVDYMGGTASDDLIADTVEYDPQSITVYGPDDVVSRIRTARVTILRENLSSTYTDELGFVFLDENDEEFDEHLLSPVKSSHESVRVTVPIKQMKNVTLTVEFLHGAGSTNQNTEFSIDPPFVTILGDPEAIRDYNSITLGTIDTTRFRDTNTYAFPIVIQNYVTNLSGEIEAQVKVDILGLDIVAYNTSNLHAINIPANHRVEWITQSLGVSIRGKREDLELVTRESLRAVVDLRDRKAGTLRIQAIIYVDGVDADVGTFENYPVTITLVREDE